MKLINGDFKGGNYPLGTEVSFFTNLGLKSGTVESLLLHAAEVQTPNEDLWKVPYKYLITESNHSPEIPLPQIEQMGRKLLADHGLHNWKFGFDLAKRRAGLCNYGAKTITLSVTYCLKADEDDIIDTILHEIAHALAGFKAKHGPKWKKIAKSIGCTGDRCSYVQHSKPRWRGTCGCSDKWKRHRLSTRMRHATCSNCDTKIKWERKA